jgi:hypothetical protein
MGNKAGGAKTTSLQGSGSTHAQSSSSRTRLCVRKSVCVCVREGAERNVCQRQPQPVRFPPHRLQHGHTTQGLGQPTQTSPKLMATRRPMVHSTNTPATMPKSEEETARAGWVSAQQGGVTDDVWLTRLTSPCPQTHAISRQACKIRDRAHGKWGVSLLVQRLGGP